MYNSKKDFPIGKCYFCLTLLFLIIHLSSYSVWGEDIYLARSFGLITSYGITPKNLSLGLELGGINKDLDILNIRSNILKNRKDELGDSNLIRLRASYGLNPYVTFSGIISRSALNYGFEWLNLYGYEMRIKLSNLFPIAIEGGLSGHLASSKKLDSISSMNSYLRRFRSDISMGEDVDMYWFDIVDGNTHVRVSIPKSESPYIKLSNMEDRTYFLRFIYGKVFENIYPNLFLEIGHSNVESRIETNILDLLPERYKDRLPTMPIDMHRGENYLKTGISSLFYLPKDFFLSIQYSYQYLFRDKSLNNISSNHKLQIRLYHSLGKKTWIFLGGVYLYHQFNGEIPFLYNKYSASLFKYQYGWLETGFSFSF